MPPPAAQLPRLAVPVCYIVCYELNGPAAGYEPLLAELRASVNWWNYLANTWVVIRHETLVELTNKLVSKVYTPDRILVLPAHGPAMGYLPEPAWKWLNDHVPKDW